MLRRPAPVEHAFTMVEVIIAMVLTVLLLALLFSSVFDLFRGSERTAQRQKAERAAYLAVEMLTDDLRAARAPDRDPKHYGSMDALRGMILQGEPAPGFTGQIHDITVATPTMLSFYADRDETLPGPECVTWFVAPDESLVRAVDPGAGLGCAGGAGTLKRQQIMPAPVARERRTAKSQIPNPFSYALQIQPNIIAPSPGSCADVTLPVAPGTMQRDQIVGVLLDIRSFVANHVAHGDQDFKAQISIPSRQGLDYRYALGCAE